VCCSVLQCVAVCCGDEDIMAYLQDVRETVSCSVLPCVAVCCSVLQCVAVCCRDVDILVCLQYVRATVCCIVVQCVVVCCSVLQCAAVCCSVLQCVAVMKISCRISEVRATWLIRICDMTHSYM